MNFPFKDIPDKTWVWGGPSFDWGIEDNDEDGVWGGSIFYRSATAVMFETSAR